eukprot:Rmarinus@m.1853
MSNFMLFHTTRSLALLGFPSRESGPPPVARWAKGVWSRMRREDESLKGKASATSNANLHPGDPLPLLLPPGVRRERVAAIERERSGLASSARAMALPGLVIFLLYVHPAITAMTLKMFTCIAIEDDSGLRFFLMADVDIECYTADHARGYLMG